MVEREKIKYRVIEVNNETENIYTILLKTPNGSPLSFIPGQYINVYFPDSGTSEGKCFSISSAPGKKKFSLSVRTMGEFSRRLAELLPGDTIVGSEPFGFFFSQSADSPLVLIASGVGIAPFRSVILDELKKNPDRPVALFYGSRSLAGAAYASEFEKLAEKHPNFSLKYFITREKPDCFKVEYGRMDGKRILTALAGFPQAGAEFFICGGVAFTRNLFRSLRGVGVPEENIFTESFI